MRAESILPRPVIDEPSKFKKVESLIRFLDDPSNARLRLTGEKAGITVITAIVNEKPKSKMPEIRAPHLEVVLLPKRNENASPYSVFDGEKETMFISNPSDIKNAIDVISYPAFHNGEPTVISTRFPDGVDSESVKNVVTQLHQSLNGNENDKNTSSKEPQTLMKVLRFFGKKVKGPPSEKKELPNILVVLHDDNIENHIDGKELSEILLKSSLE